ncbi:MAG: hypothetical protein IT379_09055 [Deltaproteobacteria bacterium]|nr:hypothetical protein [Deltaproteobacteria bacterium]
MATFEPEDFGLSQSELWDAPRKTFAQLDDRLSDAGFVGLRIAAPRLVPLGVRETFPLVVYHSATFEARRDASVEDQGAVVAVELLSNRTYAREPLLQRPERVKPTRVPPASPAPRGLIAQILVTELRERLGLPWTRGRYLVTALLRDEVSNRLVVEVDRSPVAHRDEEVERYLAAQRIERAPKDAWPTPGDPYPHYRREPAHPPTPSDVGIAMTADRVSVRREGGAVPGSALGRCVVRGSFRLPVLPHEVMPPATARSAGDRPTALVGIGLVILGSEEADPFVLQLRVPSYDPIGPTARVVTGHFALDLLAMDEMPERAQTYFLYAFSGEEMAGPIRAAILTEDMLPSAPETAID